MTDIVSNIETELLTARNNLSADRLDMSFGELLNMYEADELLIKPDFQRLFRWDLEQRTGFIESLLCGIPIPSIFMAEDSNGKWEVVDGLQRISTVLSFFGKMKGVMEKENHWVLQKGRLIPSLQDKGLRDISLKFQLNIKRAVIRVEIVKWDSKYDMRYELFRRLNTGGSPLTDQEIRNCIFRGEGNELAEEVQSLGSWPPFMSLTQISERQKSALYHDELVLRFYSLNWSSHPTGNLSDHLTDYMKAASKDHSLYKGYRELFQRVVNVIVGLNDKNVFTGSNHQFSSSKYDGITMGICSAIGRAETDQLWVKDKIRQLIEDVDFISATGVAANYKERVRARVERAQKIFQEG